MGEVLRQPQYGEEKRGNIPSVESESNIKLVYSAEGGMQVPPESLETELVTVDSVRAELGMEKKNFSLGRAVSLLEDEVPAVGRIWARSERAPIAERITDFKKLLSFLATIAENKLSLTNEQKDIIRPRLNVMYSEIMRLPGDNKKELGIIWDHIASLMPEVMH